MAWKIKGDLKGVKEAAQALEGLKRGLRNKVLRRAVTAAARVVLRSVKAAETRRRTGQLKKSLDIKVRTYSSGAVVGVIGPSRGFRIMLGKQPVDPIYYAHLVEAGVRPHALGKGSRLRDKYRAKLLSKAVYDRLTGQLLRRAQFRKTFVRAANQHGRMHPGFQGVRFMIRGWKASETAARDKATALIAGGIQQEAAKHAA